MSHKCLVCRVALPRDRRSDQVFCGSRCQVRAFRIRGGAGQRMPRRRNARAQTVAADDAGDAAEPNRAVAELARQLEAALALIAELREQLARAEGERDTLREQRARTVEERNWMREQLGGRAEESDGLRKQLAELGEEREE